MQYLGLGTVVAFALLIACGPPPENSPEFTQSNGGVITSNGGVNNENSSGAVASGGMVAAGGKMTKGGVVSSGGVGAGGFNPFGNQGGSTPIDGGGGKVFDGGISKGGSFGMGGIPVIPPKGVPLTTFYFTPTDEPCPNPKDVSAKTSDFDTVEAVCFRTVDDIAGWGCSNMTGRTVKVNGVPAECNKMPLPPKRGSFYYFEASAGGVTYASMYWYGSEHPVPACGSFPPWQSGGTATACTNPPPTDAGAGAPGGTDTPPEADAAPEVVDAL